MFLLSWILYPVVLAVLCLGCGLVVDRLVAGSLPRALLLPVGFAAAVVIATLLTVLDATSELAAPALAVTALAGFALTFRGGRLAALRPSRAWLAPLAALAIAYAALAAPVVLTGQPGLTGFVRIVDVGSQIDLARWLVEEGRSLPANPDDSSYHVLVNRLLSNGYPGGAQAALGATAQVARIDPLWAWQPFMAWMGAMLALALFALLGRAIPHRGARALAGGVAAQPTILYSYALASGIKELAASLCVALAAAVIAVAPRAAMPAGIAIAAGLCAVNIGIAPWMFVLLAAIFGPRIVAGLRGRERLAPQRRSSWLALVAVVLVAVPATGAALKLAPLLRAGGPADLGNLAAPVPFWSTIGPWLTGDHRYELSAMGTAMVTPILATFVATLATIGFAGAVSRRDRALYAVGLAAVIAVGFVIVQGTAWVELKSFAISGPLIVSLAFAGAATLSGGGWRRWLALAAGLGVVASILAGNLLVYRTVPLAPYERHTELEGLGTRYAGQGPALQPSFDEYAAYLLRDEKLIELDDVPNEVLRTPPAEGSVSFEENLDDFSLPFVQRFNLIVLRRGDPLQSRPPSDWQFVESTSYYDVYRRTPSAPVVVTHHASPGTRSARFCETLRDELGRAGPTAQIAYVAPPAGALLPLPDDVLPPGWIASDEDRLARGPGRIPVTGEVDRGGDYDVWIRGSFGRRVTVSVDGRQIGSLRWRENYPLHYEPLGHLNLSAGTHRFEIVRGGGGILPGTGNEIAAEGIITRIGPISLLRRDSRPQVRVVGERAGMAACRGDGRLDWLEVVRPR